MTTQERAAAVALEVFDALATNPNCWAMHGLPSNEKEKIIRAEIARALVAFVAEPEHVAADGSTRKSHYGTGRQPWDDIVDLGWGPAFAAGNVLKYLRRTKDPDADLKKARWYFEWLWKRAALNSGFLDSDSENDLARLALARLRAILTTDEAAKLKLP
jgi:hypothetical protein